MNMHHIRFLFTLITLSLSVNNITGQEISPLLLKSGYRTPDVTLQQWQNSYSINNENIFEGRFYKVVSFENIPSDNAKSQLSSIDIRLLSYLPVNAYFVSFPVGLDPLVLNDKGIVAVTDLSREERTDMRISGNTFPEYALRSGNRIEVAVTLFSDVSVQPAEEYITGMGWEMVRISGNGRIFNIIIPFGELYTLSGLPFVQFVEPCDPPEEHDNNRGRSLHRATTAFNPGVGLNDYDGTGVRVLINDDGYIGDHIDFQNRIPYQFTTVTGQDHGDHCAGTILGAGNLNPRGMGMAPAADLVVYRSNNYPGFDSIYNQYNTLGIRITSTSYSDGCNTGYTNRAATLDEQSRTMPELIHVFSAGNNGTSNCSYGAGSGWGNITGGHKMGKNLITVANVTTRDSLSSSSSRGPAHDGRLKPDVSALGTNVYSTSENNTYDTKTGTSMSCPGTSGTLALLYDAYKRHNGLNPKGGLIKSILLNTADDLGNPGPDFRFGYGRINARRAVRIIEDSLWHSDVISQGDSAIYSLNIPVGTKEFRTMLYWTDYEGVINTNKALVNNLDFVVAGPDSVWLPWVLNHLPNATTLNQPATRKQDTLNNAEQVTLMNPTPGTYYLKIFGTGVPMGPQQFFINWLITSDEFIVTFPHKGAQMTPGETQVIRWDALPDTSTFMLEYTVNGGSTWDTIASSIPAFQRYYEWVVPAAATGIAQIKLTRGSQFNITEQFTIIGVTQNINIDWVCIDSTKISWSAVSSATGYEIMRLGSLYMDSIASTTSTSMVLYNIPHNTPEWFTVRALGPDNASGRRTVAVYRTPGLNNCIYTYDISLTSINSPEPMLFSDCAPIPPLTVQVSVKNNGSAAISSFSAKYQINSGPVFSENVSVSLQPNQTYQHTFATPFNVSGVNDYIIKVWAEIPNDQFPFNDTLTQLVRVAGFPVLQIPFTQSFESFSLCIPQNGCAQEICQPGAGWLNPTNDIFDKTDWITHSGTTATSNTGPSVDHTLGTANGKYMYVEASYCFSATALLISPCIDLTQASLPVLSFWYHMYGSDMGALRLDILSEGVWYENQMPQIEGNQGNSWKNRLVPLDNYIGKTINIRFRATTGSNFYSDICLDDISVVETVGIADTEHDQYFSIAPNPASETITISGLIKEQGKATIRIFSQHGQVVKEYSFYNDPGVFNKTIDLSGIAEGLYIIKTELPGSTVSRKLVIAR